MARRLHDRVGLVCSGYVNGSVRAATSQRTRADAIEAMTPRESLTSPVTRSASRLTQNEDTAEADQLQLPPIN